LARAAQHRRRLPPRRRSASPSPAPPPSLSIAVACSPRWPVGSARWPLAIGALSLLACAVAVFAPTARPGRV